MKTEQEVRVVITDGIAAKTATQGTVFEANQLTQLTKEQVQDLAVIIGKALGVVDGSIEKRKIS